MDWENTHKENKRVAVKLIEYFSGIIRKPSFFITIFIIFELFPALSHKNATKLIEDKKSLVNVLYEEGKQELTPVVKEQKLSIIGFTEKHMFFYDHVDCSKIVIPKNKIRRITSGKKSSEKGNKGKLNNAY